MSAKQFISAAINSAAPALILGGFGGGRDIAPPIKESKLGTTATGTSTNLPASDIGDTRLEQDIFGGLGKSPTNSNVPIGETFPRAADVPIIGSMSPVQLWGNSAATKNNLVLSAVNLCIPGIIENLDKQRQIKCRYALCLIDDVPQGTPKQVCDDAQDYAMCTYVYGQLFGLLPIAFFNGLISQIKSFFTSPMALLSGILSASCMYLNTGSAVAYGGTACKFRSLLAQLGDIARTIGQISTIGDIFESGGKDYCEVLEDKRDTISQGSSGTGGSGSASAGNGGTQWG